MAVNAEISPISAVEGCLSPQALGANAGATCENEVAFLKSGYQEWPQGMGAF